MGWAGHTTHWTLETGATIWLRTSSMLHDYPPEGIALPIILGDATIISSKVVSSSPGRIVIEVDDGHRRRLTPGASGFSARAFPGAEWIVQRRT